MSSAPDSVKKLVDNFGEHLDHYKSSGYNETEVRREYLDPFWKALGWDIDNRSGYADQYKDVIHEDAIKVGDNIKAPDYSFRIGGTRKFFLEAKKPSVNIQHDTGPAFQLRRYAWSAKLPLSVLSDFEEFSAYDCRFKPKSNDPASNARTLYVTFDQYLDRWEEINGIFSREAILHGSFDKYVEDNKRKRGTAEVDTVFLTEIERWREILAKNLVLRNPDLTFRDLNYAVQKIIDRIIFLRICEDRGTEDYGRLDKLASGKNIYPALLKRFQQADDRYNSGLFHFTDEKQQNSAPDKLTPTLTVDDQPLRSIISNLYYPVSPYAFSVIPPDILGHVYEQFLGKTVTITGGEKRKTVKVEEKPEVRKAGGVYYTPTYIVDYIVENTLGRLLNGDNPEQPKPIAVSRAAELTVLDPACGSGSFLIVAYQYLLDWHRDQYTLDHDKKADPASGLFPLDPNKIKLHSGGKTPKIFQAGPDEYRLTVAERKRILLNNIHGVDIDSQAVEVTKLSLLLKVIEGETEQLKQRDLFKERERILPDLGQNILCGNSLIGPDFYAQPDLPELDDETRMRINVFDWKTAFPNVFKNGGFDCVIGNPPWGAGVSETERKYLKREFDAIIVRMVDSFMFFVAQSFKILRQKAIFGMIIPDVILYQKDNRLVRMLITSENTLQIAINTGNVFDRVTRPTAIVVVQKSKPNLDADTSISDLSAIAKHEKAAEFERGLTFSKSKVAVFEGLPDFRIPTSDIPRYETVGKIISSQPSLSNFVDDDGIQRGVSPDLKQAFIVTPTQAEFEKLEPQFLRSTVTGGKQIQRYWKKPEQLQLIYTSRDSDFSKCPRICEFIDRFSDQITCKEVKAKKHPIYSLHRPRNEEIFFKDEKLIGVITQDKITLHLDTEQLYPTDGLYLFSLKDPRLTKFVMGILNSNLFIFLYRSIAFESGRVLAQVKPTLLTSLPIRPIDFENADDVAKHVRMVTLVDAMLDLHQRRADEKNPDTLRQLETQITATDSQIDALVYELYDLTADEIALVEAK